MLRLMDFNHRSRHIIIIIYLTHQLTLVWQTKLLHARHVHLELALVREEVLTVAGGPVTLIGATRSRLGPVVLIGCRCPFLARLSN
jgi:hypothetical protein